MMKQAAVSKIAVAVLCLLAEACSSRLLEQTTEQAPRAGEAAAPLTLPRVATLGRKVEAVQLVTARYNDQQMSFDVRLSIDGQRLLFVATDLTGQRAMTLRWSDAGTTSERAEGVPDLIGPQATLSDLVLLYWPAEVVRQTLGPDGEVVEDGRSRIVRRGDREVMRARYDWDPGQPWNGIVRYRNDSLGYEIEVQSQELAR